MRLIPMGANLIVRLDPVKEQKIGGDKGVLWTPDKTSTPSRIGTIVGMGPDLKGHAIGDRVAVNYYNGVVVEMPRYRMNGDCIRICTEREILSKIVEEDDENIGMLAPAK